MGEIINMNNSVEPIENCNDKVMESESDLIALTEDILLDTRTDISNHTSLSVPISKLSTLGVSVASLIPSLRTVTQTTTVNTEGLYRLANVSVGDTLKVAKNGNFWGAFKNIEGQSKLLQIQDAGPLSVTNTSMMPIDPAMMMMAVALFSIEQQLDNIVEMGRQIMSFLEIEKESEIEADVQTLNNIIVQYKNNWDNEHFITSNHKMVLDIQRTARKHMNSYQKKITDDLNSKKSIVAQSKINSMLKDFQKTFKYYRLSLYTFTLASFIEIMLSGNFREKYITEIKSEIESLSSNYRNIFAQCSVHLEKIAGNSVEANVLNGIGTASKVVGKVIGSIPILEKGPVDEFLQDKGIHLKSNARDIKENIVSSFSVISNPGTGVFIKKMSDLIQIYNHTSQICFDEKKIYLIAE